MEQIGTTIQIKIVRTGSCQAQNESKNGHLIFEKIVLSVDNFCVAVRN